MKTALREAYNLLAQEYNHLFGTCSGILLLDRLAEREALLRDIMEIEHELADLKYDHYHIARRRAASRRKHLAVVDPRDASTKLLHGFQLHLQKRLEESRKGNDA